MNKTYYAVNLQTREHALTDANTVLYCGWGKAEADAEGWVEWRGGVCPLPNGVDFEYMMNHEDDIFDDVDNASELRWSHKGSDSDITAYRPVLPTPHPQWSGPEDGLPPVGVEAIFSTSAKDVDWPEGLNSGDLVSILAHYQPHERGPEVAVFTFTRGAGRDISQAVARCFSPLPIITSEQRAEEASVNAMVDAAGWQCSREDCEDIYAAIRDGKIPGVELTK